MQKRKENKNFKFVFKFYYEIMRIFCVIQILNLKREKKRVISDESVLFVLNIISIYNYFNFGFLIFFVIKLYKISDKVCFVKRDFELNLNMLF